MCWKTFLHVIQWNGSAGVIMNHDHTTHPKMSPAFLRSKKLHIGVEQAQRLAERPFAEALLLLLQQNDSRCEPFGQRCRTSGRRGSTERHSPWRCSLSQTSPSYIGQSAPRPMAGCSAMTGGNSSRSACRWSSCNHRSKWYVRTLDHPKHLLHRQVPVGRDFLEIDHTAHTLWLQLQGAHGLDRSNKTSPSPIAGKYL